MITASIFINGKTFILTGEESEVRGWMRFYAAQGAVCAATRI